ncbi:MAG: glycoside hydrolase family 3 C-terminal domain-containing protein [Bacilli bacterium]|nr:glycoside hydrolase family 3 C-terminal domain-containing protein [Bacilli bacterium]
MNFKNLLKKRVIIWGASTLVLAGVLVAANVVAGGIYSDLLDQVFGPKTAIVSDEKNDLHLNQVAKNKQEALSNGNATVEKICEEGMVLLKNENNALPLKANASVSVFGKNAANLVYGGSGSAAPGGNAPRKTIYDSLRAAGIAYNPKLEEFYNNNSKSGSGRSANPAMENSGVPTLKTGETPIEKYTNDITSSYDQYGDAALVVFSRIAGENWDLPRKADDDPNRHYLELDNNERALLKHICDSNKFEHIIVLLNGSNYIDCGFLKITTDPAYNAKIDACINIGSPGGNGIMALGKILSGAVNPSGHTVDTVYTNYKNDPTWQNFGGNFEKDGDAYILKGSKVAYYTVDYEENIYLGYRYYETRGHLEGEEWYNKNVIYPFGYGLSYTTFSQSIVNKSELATALSANEKFTVKIDVTNTGTVAGKQVVQLYVNTPYIENGIEKPYKTLVGFAKTPLLAPGAKTTTPLEIEVDPYYFASFDSHDKNNNGKKTYELDAGTYTFFAGTDAHHDFDSFQKTLATTAVIENDPVTNTKVEPLFDDVTNNMKESLSRKDFAGTFPHTITDEERTINIAFMAKLKSMETTNTDEYTVMPKTNVDSNVQLFDLYGKDYNDPLWDTFLNQLKVKEMLDLFNKGCYSTAGIQRLGIPATTSVDGPTGMVAFLGNPAVYDCCYYCSECLVAQTYNLDLATDQAHAIGDESIIGNEKGNGLSYPGWYAPGVNLHRSPFSGRNTEYYSEDPFLNGRFAATVIKGVQERGVYANVKHFAINDQETHRSANGIATWVDEQAMRELYFRPFEMAVKEGKSRGLMTSFNRIGTEWAGGSYRLVTTILRKEWGFQGSVICDFHTGKYMDSKQMLYAGGDLNLAGDDQVYLQTSGKYNTPYIDVKSAKDVSLLRQASHHLLYSVGNSNAMVYKIVGYKPAGWQVVLTASTIGVSVALVIWGGAAIATALLPKKKQEENVA